ncbi:MAG TPA: alpha/beta hydrolase [Actinomycetes bacterium]|nr:alpha/beta hydrolase [Actinomycetes bacterium]
MTSPPILLVPGFWLGAWAWEEVAAFLRGRGHEVVALTLPGLESEDADRSRITLADHVDAIGDAIIAAGRPVVLAVHSGAGVPGYMATDRLPHLIANAVYVDSGPATGALDPDFEGDEYPLPPWDELEADEANSVGEFTPEQLERFRTRSVPEPAGAMRDAPVLRNPARLDVPTTVICTTMPSEEIQAAARKGYAWIGGLAELHDVTYVDLPTSHWPMWTKPRELAGVLSEIAARSG